MMEVVIAPQKRIAIKFDELWTYRELFYFFAWRDIKVRYKQTLIGASWAIVQPLATMVVFTVFFNKIAGIKSGAVPYAIFSYTGLLFWNYFSTSLVQVSGSMVANQSVITKLYFPRVIIPVSSMLQGLVDFLFASVVFAALLVYYGIVPGAVGLLLVIPMLALTALSSLGLGLFFTALNVKYRDVRALLPFLVQLGLFLTPVIYPVSLVPQRYHWLLDLNPMAGVIGTMRAALIHQGTIPWSAVGIGTLVAVTVFCLGLRYFVATERRFADII